MANILQDLSNELGLSYVAKDKLIYGEYRGYKVAVKEYNSAGVFLIKFPISSDSDEGTELIGRLAADLKVSDKKISESSYSDGSLYIKLAKALKSETTKDSIKNIIDEVTTFAASNEFRTVCEGCKLERVTSPYQISNYPMFFCDSCHSQILSDIEAPKEKVKEKPQNLLFGIVGALIGSLLGVAVWVIVYSLGYIAAVCGFVLAVCTIKGYELLGGKLNKVGIAITFLLTLVMVYVATHLSYSFELYNEAKKYGEVSLIDSIKSISTIKQNFPEINDSFTKDLVIGYVFTLIGSVSSFVSIYKEKNFKINVKKVDESI